MKRCPVCGRSDALEWRSLAVAFLLAAIVFFVAGQLFFQRQVAPIFQDKLSYYEKRDGLMKDELRKSVPSRGR